MTIRNTGIPVGQLYLPPFLLNAGELLVINIGEGGHYQKTAAFLTDLITGAFAQHGFEVFAPFESFRKARWSWLLPFLQRYPPSTEAEKLTALNAAMDKGVNVVFDLSGLSPNAAIEVWPVLQDYAAGERCVVVIDKLDEFRDSAHQYVALQVDNCSGNLKTLEESIQEVVDKKTATIFDWKRHLALLQAARRG